ncbi:RNA polymerase sigma-70 factor [Arundinibacter roseus]|uniref:RNA polymerase sigma-70 factor n=1 Tax=Arundinibacter roseus TaxID=2070510 RepID=A0A4R4KJ70_9BACT|nr:RNA polymerase sigma-70 factor [Arundinibacter roseus]TDB67953.1 RNA polymerase sigma-70 factor [Arundinibacter roseus]
MSQITPLDPWQSQEESDKGPRKDFSQEENLNAYQADTTELLIRKTFETNPQKGCELLFRRYYRAMCTHAVRFVYSKEIAEDIVGEIFYSFWNTKAYESVTTSYRAYLFRSVRNRSYNYLSNDLRKSDSLLTVQPHQLAQVETPEQLMQIEELLEKVNALISTLTPQCRKVFLMNRFEGRAPKDIATELNLSNRTIETHIYKALSILKSGLKDQWLWLTILSFCH